MSDENGGLVEQLRVSVFAFERGERRVDLRSADPMRGRLRIASDVASRRNPATSMKRVVSMICAPRAASPAVVTAVLSNLASSC
jgi:hypothetical protein